MNRYNSYELKNHFERIIYQYNDKDRRQLWNNGDPQLKDLQGEGRKYRELKVSEKFGKGLILFWEIFINLHGYHP